jgi:hypothetical protein
MFMLFALRSSLNTFQFSTFVDSTFFFESFAE